MALISCYLLHRRGRSRDRCPRPLGCQYRLHRGTASLEASWIPCSGKYRLDLRSRCWRGPDEWDGRDFSKERKLMQRMSKGNMEEVIFESYQWFQGVKILDLIATQVDMSQFGTAQENIQTITDAVITEFEPLQRWQFGKSFQTSQTHIDHTQRVQTGIFLGESFNLSGPSVVEVEIFNLKMSHSDLNFPPLSAVLRTALLLTQTSETCYTEVSQSPYPSDYFSNWHKIPHQPSSRLLPSQKTRPTNT